MNMSIKEQAVEFIKQHETCRLQADFMQNEWVIGYNCKQGVYNGLTWTQEQAEAMLAKQVQTAGAIIDKHIFAGLNNNQKVALISLLHDVGLETLRNSEIFNLCNKRNFVMAASTILSFNKIGRTVSVHKSRRRNAEKALFLEPYNG